MIQTKSDLKSFENEETRILREMSALRKQIPASTRGLDEAEKKKAVLLQQSLRALSTQLQEVRLDMQKTRSAL